MVAYNFLLAGELESKVPLGNMCISECHVSSRIGSESHDERVLVQVRFVVKLTTRYFIHDKVSKGNVLLYFRFICGDGMG